MTPVRIPAGHSCSRVDRDITYTIGFDDLCAAASRDARIGEMTSKGSFVYVDGHLCLNDPEFVMPHQTRKGTIYTLTQKALDQIDQCCVSFCEKKNYRGTASYNYGYAGRDKTVPVTDIYKAKYDLHSVPEEPGYARGVQKDRSLKAVISEERCSGCFTCCCEQANMNLLQSFSKNIHQRFQTVR